MAKKPTDPAVLRAASIFEKKGITLEDLGLRMGFPQNTARRAAWQLLHLIHDPKLSTVRKLAKALEVAIGELVKDESDLHLSLLRMERKGRSGK